MKREKGKKDSEKPSLKEFLRRLEDPGGRNFREYRTPYGQPDPAWPCSGKGYATNGPVPFRWARAVMSAMGIGKADQDAALTFFEANGSHCDCEIISGADPKRRPPGWRA